MKLCECGCGQPAPIASQTRPNRSQIKGQPIRFISGHNSKLQPTGKESPNWKGGRYIDSTYNQVCVYRPRHPKCNRSGYVREHRCVAEKTLGKPLPAKSVVHHIDENGCNNNKNNLVICENTAYHLYLHKRIRAYRSCGNPKWLKCPHCKQYDDPKNLFKPAGRNQGSYHEKCKALYDKPRTLKRYGGKRTMALLDVPRKDRVRGQNEI